jgi:hypothetical protein
MKMLILHENDLMPRELALTKIWRGTTITLREVWTYIRQAKEIP